MKVAMGELTTRSEMEIEEPGYAEVSYPLRERRVGSDER